MGKWERRKADGSWETPALKGVIQATGMQLEATYIGFRQATVAQWVDLQPLLEVCAQKTG